MWKLGSWMVLIGALSGCASAKVSKTDLRPDLYSAPSASVEIFTGKDRVTKKYDELAIVVSDDQGWEMTEGELTKELVSEAKKIGADAIILMPTQSTSDAALIVSGNMATAVPVKTTVTKAVAIKWKK